MLATVIISVGVLGFVQAFSVINKATQAPKGTSLATNLAQERIESLKNVSYYRLVITTSTETDTRVTPNFDYDDGYYALEKLQVGGLVFDRMTYITRVDKSTGSDSLIELSGIYPDTGLKLIKVWVVWQEGQTWKHVALQNLRENPSRTKVNSDIKGTITKTDAVTAIPGAVIEVIENPTWYAQADNDGKYSFAVAGGNYTLRIYRSGYFTQYINVSVSNNSSLTQDVQLSAMATGNANATVYLRDHIVISQVVASTVSAAQNQEYVELYNPTTYSWTINDASFDVRYVDANNTEITDIALTFRNTSIPANGGYYLIANTGTVTAAGAQVVADAVYTTLLANTIKDAKAGGIQLTNDDASVTFDKAGWSRNAEGAAAPSKAVEGTQITLTSGLTAGEQLARSSETFTTIDFPSGASAWDANANATDFNVGTFPQDRTLTYAPRNTSTIYAPKGGTPAVGAYVTADDTLSSTVLANATGYFDLTSIATGTWTITVSSKGSMAAISNVTITDGSSVALGQGPLDAASSYGYIYGTVRAGANPVGFYGSDTVQVTAGSARTFTAPTSVSPNYYLIVAAGSATVTANAANANPKFTSGATDVVVAENGVILGDVSVSLGGQMWGRVMIGSSYLPNVAVSAKLGGLEKGSAMSGEDGIWRILNLSVGAYTVEPILESGETASPSSQIVDIATEGDNIQAATITVTNAFGSIRGQVTNNNSSITTGVLVIASTSTFAGDPPTMSSGTLSGVDVYYATSSLADGTYTLSVRGGYVYNVYAWFTTISQQTPSTARKNVGSVNVAAAGTVNNVNFSWP